MDKPVSGGAMNDARDALAVIDTVAMLDSYAAVVEAVERARRLDGADEVEPGLAQRVLGAARRFRQPPAVVEHHLCEYLSVEDETWRRCQTAAAVATEYPGLARYHDLAHEQLSREPASPTRDAVLALSESVRSRLKGR
ncbi:MAG: hypothetical protein Tsb0020_22120 [Haliangiales bacterium]